MKVCSGGVAEVVTVKDSISSFGVGVVIFAVACYFDESLKIWWHLLQVEAANDLNRKGGSSSFVDTGHLTE